MAACMRLDFRQGRRVMLFHRWSACASRLRKASGTFASAILAVALGIAPAQAEPRKAAHGSGEFDTEHMFGFTEGSDVGGLGEKELETDTTGRFGRAAGSYNNVATALEAKYTFTENFRVSAAATVSSFDITGVNGFDNRRQTALQGFSIDARFRLLDRERAPIGLTIGIIPQWGLKDDVSGAPADQHRTEFLLIADRELMPDRLFGAINVGYEQQRTRLRVSDETSHDSALGVSAALAAQLMPGVFIGAEARNIRLYEGLGLDRFAGQAVYVGPTLYMTLGAQFWLSAAWNVQAWGATAADGGALDLTNFERHQVRFRLGVNF
jgi:hypothetical protein